MSLKSIFAGTTKKNRKKHRQRKRTFRHESLEKRELMAADLGVSLAPVGLPAGQNPSPAIVGPAQPGGAATGGAATGANLQVSTSTTGVEIDAMNPYSHAFGYDKQQVIGTTKDAASNIKGNLGTDTSNGTTRAWNNTTQKVRVTLEQGESVNLFFLSKLKSSGTVKAKLESGKKASLSFFRDANNPDKAPKGTTSTPSMVGAKISGTEEGVTTFSFDLKGKNSLTIHVEIKVTVIAKPTEEASNDTPEEASNDTPEDGKIDFDPTRVFNSLPERFGRGGGETASEADSSGDKTDETPVTSFGGSETLNTGRFGSPDTIRTDFADGTADDGYLREVDAIFSNFGDDLDNDHLAGLQF